MKNFKLGSHAIALVAMTGCAQLGGTDSHVIRTLHSEPTETLAEAAFATESISLVHFEVDSRPQPDDSASAFATSSSDIAVDTDPMALEPVVIPLIPSIEDANNGVTDGGEISAGRDDLTSTSPPPVNEMTYTLADIERLALEGNPTLVAAGAVATKASGLRYQVGVRPNPTLGYFGQQIADRNTDQHGLFIEQEFVRGDKLAINREVLGHTSSAQRGEMETQRYRVLTDVRVRFFEAVAAQQQLDATLDFAQLARRGVEVAEDRKRAEEGTLIEVLQSKTLLSEVTLAAEQSAAAYRGAWQDLAAIAGLSASTPARLVMDLNPSGETPNWDAAYDQIVSNSPELTVANALVCEKQSLLKRQQVQMIPNFTAQVGAGYDDGTDHGMINIQLSAPIPVWNQNQGNISAAYADYTRALENVRRVEQSIKSRLARTAQEFEASMASVNKYQQEIIPQAKKSLDLSEEAYRAGELDFLQVLIVRRSFYESTIRFIDAKGKLAQASAKIDGMLLTGGLDAPQDYTDGDGIRGQAFDGM
ncbi:Cobalt-zinc-cadmium resistance protein CzcC precursor [Rubripirellula tenax]|uniref:Cobalt-zinc-cadmium resistance protein CzcC n=2 Tax=Rubripirellula tenax TaxID=2528015 RepID=A0A5C6FB60_9BACT|nr:Cobalt-zinc-cadmium resistance protein CzcC precursor [Rubripirellula tenax]